MGFIGGTGFISGITGKQYDYKSKMFATLNIGEDTFVLAGVLPTDNLIVYDHFGVVWDNPKNYTRIGVNLDTVKTNLVMTEKVDFTIYVFE